MTEEEALYKSTRLIVSAILIFLLGSMGTCTYDNYLVRESETEKLKILADANVSGPGITCIVTGAARETAKARACAQWIEESN